MATPNLRPPLPESLSHEGIAFVLDCGGSGGAPSPEVISAIAAALQEILPSGDLVVDGNGVVHIKGVAPHTQNISLWHYAGLLAGIERSSL